MSDFETVNDLLKTLKNSDDVKTGLINKESERIPTGIIDMDFALGGGIPRHRVTQITGNPGASKSTVALRIAKSFLDTTPGKKLVILDIEGEMNSFHYNASGISDYMESDRVVNVTPNCTTELLQYVAVFMQVQEVGMILVDSVAAIGVDSEVNPDEAKNGDFIGKAKMGGISGSLRSFYRQCNAQLNRMEAEGRECALVLINQLTTDFSGYRPVQKPTGGKVMTYWSRLEIRMTKEKEYNDSSVSSSRPAYASFKATFPRIKVGTYFAKECSYDMHLIDGGKYSEGYIDNAKSILKQAKNSNAIISNKKGYTFMGVDYNTQKEIKDRLDNEPEFLLESLNYLVNLQKTGEL